MSERSERGRVRAGTDSERSERGSTGERDDARGRGGGHAVDNDRVVREDLGSHDVVNRCVAGRARVHHVCVMARAIVEQKPSLAPGWGVMAGASNVRHIALSVRQGQSRPFKPDQITGYICTTLKHSPFRRTHVTDGERIGAQIAPQRHETQDIIGVLRVPEARAV